MPLDLYKRLKIYCLRNNTTMHDVISQSLEEYFSKKEPNGTDDQ